MALLPSGERMWPSIRSGKIFAAVPSVRQFQMIQHSTAEIELKLVVDGRVSAEHEEHLRRELARHMGHPFAFRFTYVEDIRRSAGGKYEDFICRVQR